MYIFGQDHPSKENVLDAENLVTFVLQELRKHGTTNQVIVELVQLLNDILVKECTPETNLDDDHYGGDQEEPGKCCYDVGSICFNAYKDFMIGGGHELLDDIDSRGNLNENVHDCLRVFNQRF